MQEKTSKTYSVEDEVTHDHQINSGLTAQNGEHVGRHPLPEVDQEILNLRNTGEKGVMKHFFERGEGGSHLLEVGSYDRVEDPLTVSLVHDQKGLHLQTNEQTACDKYRLILKTFFISMLYIDTQ